MRWPAVHAQSRFAHEAVEHGAKVSKPLCGDTNPAAKLFNDSGSGTSASTPSSSSSEMGRRGGMSGHLSRAEVTELQRALNRNGAGLRVDGAMGPRTREALMSYQARNDLPVSGHLDSDTRMKIGREHV